MTFRKCKNLGCEEIIEVRKTEEGWRPYLESGRMHDCKFSEYAKKQKAFGENTTRILEHRIPAAEVLKEDKDDHGNELVEPLPSRPVDYSKLAEDKKEYVDHTAKVQQQQQRFTAFSSDSADGLTEKVDNWIDEHQEFIRVKLIGQLQLDNGTFAIAIYYEEISQQ